MVGRTNSQIVCPVGAVSRTKDNTCSAWYTLISLAMLICLLAIPVFSGLWQLWNSDKNFAGLMLVPCMCGFILLKSKNDFASIRPTPIRAAFYILPVSIGGMMVLFLYGYTRLSGLFFVLNLVIISFGVIGCEAKKVLLCPLLFLTLMVPPSQNFVGFLTVSLQRFFSFVMELFLPVFSNCFVGRDGFAFWFAGTDYRMIISPECSGIRSLSGFAIISLFLAVLNRHKISTTFIMLIAGTIVALALNFMRIVVTMQLRLHGLEDYSVGSWHGFLGMAIFLVGCVTLSKLSRFLKTVGSVNKKE